MLVAKQITLTDEELSRFENYVNYAGSKTQS